MHIIGKTEQPAPSSPEAAAAKNAADREEAAHHIHQYLIARIVNPKAARAMPEMVDLQILLDERKALLQLLEQAQAKQVRTLALVLKAVGVERVEIPESLVVQLEGYSIRQTVEPTMMILELVPPPKDDAAVDEADSEPGNG